MSLLDDGPYNDDEIFASLERENDYWKRVGGHPPAGHEDVPRTYECEAKDCNNADTSVSDGGTLEQCSDCGSMYCPAHRVPSAKGNEELCMDCSHARRVALLVGEG